VSRIISFAVRVKKIRRAIEDFEQLVLIEDSIYKISRIMGGEKSDHMAKYIYSLKEKEAEKVKKAIKKYMPGIQ